MADKEQLKEIVQSMIDALKPEDVEGVMEVAGAAPVPKAAAGNNNNNNNNKRLV